MNLNEQLIQGIAAASEMTLVQVEEALADGANRTLGELTALSLMKKAAEGGMDAVKLMRELSKNEHCAEFPRVEIRVIGPDDE
ncbi:MAG: hypothetical protein IJ407_01815 [Clostridia bacterium]|nr:hypothetical protein [Clostridia bacterium]